MKRNTKRLPALLLAIVLCLSLLPVTALAADFPSRFYASIIFSSSTEAELFGLVTQSGGKLNYTKTGVKTDHVVCGMEYAGGAFFTVEGTRGKGSSQSGNYIMTDDGWRELRIYNRDLSNYRVIGEINPVNGPYTIVDTAIDLSGEEPVLYGTYNQEARDTYVSILCTVNLETAALGDYLMVSGDLPKTDIIYAIAFNEDGTLYAIGAAGAEEGGPASLYTLDLENASQGQVSADLVGPIERNSIAISTNFAQDMAFDYETNTLYWMENKDNHLYILDTDTAEATSVMSVQYSGKSYPLQSFCIPNDTTFAGEQHMISVICTGGGKVTSNGEEKTFYRVAKNEDFTLALTPDDYGALLSVKVDGAVVPIEGLTENGYIFKNVTENHVIEVTFRPNLPVTQKDMTWFHYQGYPASFYTQHEHYEFYALPYNTDAPTDGYTQTLLDKEGNEIDNDERIIAGSYDVRITHDGTEDYNALSEVFRDALQLAKCPGTPGRPVVYGKVGCTQGDLATTSALQDYYREDGSMTGTGIYDKIPVTLVWQDPDIKYEKAGYYYANAAIYAAENLEQRILDCYNLDDGKTPISPKCQISHRSSQVVVLKEDEASLIKVQANDNAGGTVSGKGVYKNDDDVTVTATVNAGYEFKGWQKDNDDDFVSTNPTYVFKAEGDCTLTAVFAPPSKDYYVALLVEPDGAGTVTGGGSYENVAEKEANVTAQPNQGYYFDGWYKAGETQAVSTKASDTFPVPQNGITLTAKFGVDYLARAEQAKDSLKSSLGTGVFEWSTLTQAVAAYEEAAEFMNNLPTGVENAGERFDDLTNYYKSVEELDFSNLGIGNDELAQLSLFTGVTDLNLSGNKNVTDLTNLKHMTQLKTLNLSNTGMADLSSLSSLTKLETLDLSGNKTISDLSGLSGLRNLDTLNLSGNKSVTDLSVLKGLWLETLDISGTGVTTTDDFASSLLTTVKAQNLSLTSISALAKLIKEDGVYWYKVELLDFTGSTLSNTEENKADVEAIQGKLRADQFILPTIRTASSGGGGGVITYTVRVPEELTGGTLTVSPKQATKDTVITITATPDKGYELEKLTVTDAKGNELLLTDRGDGTFVFTMPDNEVTVEAAFREAGAESANPFVDVQESDYYYDAVLWAVANGVTNGMSDDAFAPNSSCTRAQIVTFLWRAHGSPEATGSNPFTDVQESDYYYDAVLWAVANGVTNGITDTTFNPNDTCTRAQAVTFQWRASGSPAASGGNFDDVAADTWYTGAVTWAVANGITNGTSDSNFSPDVVVSRAQAVTFLYRELA